MHEKFIISRKNQSIKSKSESETTILTDEEKEEDDDDDEQYKISDSEVEHIVNSATVALPNSSDTFGNIHVEKSKCVYIGSRTVIKGQITINQILQTHRGSNDSSEIQTSPKDNVKNKTENQLKFNDEPFSYLTPEKITKNKGMIF